jgi:hypothetical protein
MSILLYRCPESSEVLYSSICVYIGVQYPVRKELSRNSINSINSMQRIQSLLSMWFQHYLPIYVLRCLCWPTSHVYGLQKNLLRQQISSSEKKRARAEVLRLKHHASFHALIMDYGIERIISTFRVLLRGGIFESNSKARILFSRLRCTPDSREEIQISLGNRTSSHGIIPLDHAELEYTTHGYQELKE